MLNTCLLPFILHPSQKKVSLTHTIFERIRKKNAVPPIVCVDFCGFLPFLFDGGILLFVGLDDLQPREFLTVFFFQRLGDEFHSGFQIRDTDVL